MTRDRGVSDRRLSKPSNPQRSTSRRRSLGQRVLQSIQGMTQPGTPKPRIGVAKSAAQAKTAVGSLSLHARDWLVSDWRILVALSLLMTSGLTTISASFLFRLPAVPDCPSIFWPLASASLRMQCAQLSANKRTVNDLLDAIKLLSVLPSNHSMHDEITRLIEMWSRDIFDLGEEAFQAGKLQDAIDAARKVPKDAAIYKEAEERVKRWQGIWSAAETLYRKAEDALRKRNWRQASTEAARLLSVENAFWQTTQYQGLTEKIALTRQDISKLAKAEGLMESGGVENFLEAIKIASSIDSQSYVRQSAQEILAKTGRKMFDLADEKLERRDLMAALDIVRQIPEAANLQKEVEDFDRLANAQARAWGGTEVDIDASIADAKGISIDRPLYQKAQNLIIRWQLEKTDIAQLNRAQQLIQTNRPEDLQAAIAIASQIPDSNPRGPEARQLIDRITSDVQDRQDRPILQQAEQIASRGDLPSLQQAISTVSQIGSGRSLSEEAQRKKQLWATQVQQLQDQARTLTESRTEERSDLSVSNGASVNPSSNPMFGDPQGMLRDQEQAARSMQSARESAGRGTIDSFAEAIRQADGVPVSSPMRKEAEQYMNRLGQQMLQSALSQSNSDVPGAIATALKIPPSTNAYSQAQLQIQVWRRRLGQ